MAICLVPIYQLRIDELAALSNKAKMYDDNKLPDLRVIILRGEWIAQDLLITSAEKAEAEDNDASGDVMSVLNPPEGGQKVRATTGEICLDGDGCEDVSWDWSRLGDTARVQGYAQSLHLALSQPVLEGRPVDEEGAEILLIPGGGGRISAIANICGYRSDVCRTMLQAWTPTGAVELPTH